MNPQDLVDGLGGIPAGWSVEPGNGKAAPGWKMFEVRGDGSRTGNLIRWNWTPNSPGHPEDEWQWTVNIGSTVNEKVPGGNWPGGPEEFVGNTGGIAGNVGSSGDGSGGPGDQTGNPGSDPCEASYSVNGGSATLEACGSGGFGGWDPFGDDDPVVEAGFGQQAWSCEAATEPTYLL
jgi:hypothetical protein